MEYAIFFVLVVLVGLLVWSVARQSKLPDRVQRVEDLMSNVVKEVTEARVATVDAKSKTIEEVTRVQGDLTAVRERTDNIITEVRQMSTAILVPTKRGPTGETLLGAILEDILPAQNVLKNHRFKDGSVVEYAVCIKEMVIPIDAKFPGEAYRKFVEAMDDRERKAADTEFKTAIKKAAGDIKKSYVKPEEGASFALMYLPAEGVFYHLISAHADSVEEMRRGSVFPVGPTTVVAYLETIARGLQGLQIEKRAREILGGLDELARGLTNLKKPFNTATDHLRNAQKNLDDAFKGVEGVEASVSRLRTPLREDSPPQD
jgi:DNA recombination protein RmuC